MGPVVAYPGVDLQVGYNDNIYLRPSNVVGSAITLISPYVKFETRSGPNVYDVLYRGEFARYHDAPSENYTSQLLQANARLVFNARNDLRLRVEERTGIDPRGSTDRSISAEPDAWRQTTVFGLYGYGAAGNPGRFELDAGWIGRSYTNNRTFTSASDRATTDLGATLFWRVAPKTRMLLQVRQAYIDYAQEGGTQTSTESRYFVGAQWEATAKTTGYFKLGWMEKQFQNGGSRTESSPAWDLGVRWSPLSYSVVDVLGQRSFVESTGIGDAIISTRTNIAWTHAWNSRLNQSLYWTKVVDNFVGNGASRNDDTNAIGFRVSYQAQRWLRLGAEYAYTVRDSNESEFNYRRNLLMFTVGGTL